MAAFQKGVGNLAYSNMNEWVKPDWSAAVAEIVAEEALKNDKVYQSELSRQLREQILNSGEVGLWWDSVALPGWEVIFKSGDNHAYVFCDGEPHKYHLTYLDKVRPWWDENKVNSFIAMVERGLVEGFTF